MNEKKEIIIDLDRSKYPNISHDSSELIQQEAIEQLKKHMNMVVAEYGNPDRRYTPEIDKCDNEDENSFMAYGHFRRRHDVIALLGERGTGKSNFLVNLKSILREDDFAFLKILDPTLFDDRQNILVAIIFMLQDLVEKYRDKNQKYIYEQWLNFLGELSEGLSLVDDGIGNNPMKKDLWDDARLVLDKGLRASRAGYTFERNFHKLLSLTLQLIGKKAIILRFDDIDTNPEKGWNVLEVIRKYLTTPHLQVIISGDWKLYSKIVRLEQWNRLHKLQEYKDDIDLKKIIDDLEEQYTSKILQPNNRIYLRTLKHIAYNSESDYNILIKKADQKEKGKIERYLKDIEPTVRNVYVKILNEVFNLSHNLLDNACALLMTLPIRTNLQVLGAYDESLSDDRVPILNQKVFMGKFTNVFLTLIDRFDFSYRDFQKLFEPSGYNLLANKMNKLSEKHTELTFDGLMTPEVVFEDDDINLFLLFINGFVAQSMNKAPGLIFDWYYRIQMLSELITKFGNTEKLQKAKLYLDYKKRISTYKVAIKISGLLLKEENIKGKNDYLGFSMIYRDNKEATIHYGLNKLEERIDNGTYTTILEVKDFIKVLLSITTKNILIKKDKETLTLVGIHYILGFLANTLENDNTGRLLKKMSYPNTIREFKNGENIDSRIAYGERIYDANILEDCEVKNNCEINKLATSLESWKKNRERISNFSIQQMDYLWKEYNSREMEIEYCSSAGKYLEVQIFLFLDTFMRAQLNYNQLLSYKVIKKPDKARLIFLENIKKYYKYIEEKNFTDGDNLNIIINYVKSKEEISIFDFFLICPLWNYYSHFENLEPILCEDNLFSSTEENNINDKSLADIVKEDGYYSGIFKDLEISTSTKAKEDGSLRQLSIGKTDKEIIADNLNLIDENKLFATIKSLMQKAKDPNDVKRISKIKVNQWIEIYRTILDEKVK